MIRTALLILPVLALGACASEIGNYGGDMHMANENFGHAVRQNIAVQTVNPTPSTATVVVSGERAATAVDAYRKDTVKDPGSATTMAMKANAGSEGKQ
jgi:type IV pilus biogenesis protein CpaD/CtpE